MLLKAIFSVSLFFHLQYVNGFKDIFNANVAVGDKEYLVGLERVNFYQALIKCQQNGLYLATVNSAAEEKVLTTLLKPLTKNGEWDGFWLSGTNLQDSSSNKTSREYYWLTGGEKIVYTDWGLKQPDYPLTENCIGWLNYTNSTTPWSGWNDYVCTVEIRYICQLSNK